MALISSARFRLIVTLAFWGALAVAVTMAVLPHPPYTPIDRFGDKTEHMLAFATLAGLAQIAWPRAPRWRILAGLSAVGAGIEFVQMLPALHRDAEFADWIADTLAIALVLAIGWVLIGRRKAV